MMIITTTINNVLIYVYKYSSILTDTTRRKKKEKKKEENPLLGGFPLKYIFSFILIIIMNNKECIHLVEPSSECVYPECNGGHYYHIVNGKWVETDNPELSLVITSKN